MPSFQHLLVPIEFSESSRSALECAATFARLFGADVDVLHVWEPPAFGVEDLPVVQVPRIKLDDFANAPEGAEMRVALEILARAGVTARGRVETGTPWRTIVHAARHEPYDLIVMGTHGRTGIAHLLMGGVAEKVVRHAPCAVLTVRANTLEAREVEPRSRSRFDRSNEARRSS